MRSTRQLVACYPVISPLFYSSLTTVIACAGLVSPEGLAVDWVSRTVFYTDSALDLIGVAALDGSYRKVIVDSGLINPRAIAVDPMAG